MIPCLLVHDFGLSVVALAIKSKVIKNRGLFKGDFKVAML